MRTKAWLFERSRSVIRALPARAETVHSFLWLHVLNARDVDEITLHSYEGPSGFESEAHNLQPLWAWEHSAYEQYFAASNSILVAGAGGGREMIALARMGFQVTGFDASSDLVAACKDNLQKANISAEILVASPAGVPAECGVHDALVIGRGVYHHIPGRARRIRFLQECRKHIKPGAPLVMGDFHTRGDKRPLTAFALSRKIEEGDAIGDSFVHYFTGHEIKTELEDAGFELVQFRPTPFPGASLGHATANSIRFDEMPLS